MPLCSDVTALPELWAEQEGHAAISQGSVLGSDPALHISWCLNLGGTSSKSVPSAEGITGYHKLLINALLSQHIPHRSLSLSSVPRAGGWRAVACGCR